VSQAVPRRYETTEIAGLSADRRYQSVQAVTRWVWEKWWETGCKTSARRPGSRLSNTLDRWEGSPSNHRAFDKGAPGGGDTIVGDADQAEQHPGQLLWRRGRTVSGKPIVCSNRGVTRGAGHRGIIGDLARLAA
jgi:hypothetical protein